MASFTPAKVGTLKVKLAMNNDGKIAQNGETAISQKAINLNGFKAKGSFENAKTVFDKIFTGIAGGTYDELSAEKTVTRKVTN